MQIQTSCLHPHVVLFLLARLFYKTEEVLSPPARRLRLRQRPVKFLGKLLRQKIMSSFISSLAQNLFIFAVLIHMVVLINNQALINIQIYYFSHFFHVLAMFQLRIYLCEKIVKAKDHVQFYIKFSLESFHICCVDSYGCPY